MSDVRGLDGKTFKPEEKEGEKQEPCKELVETLKTLLADAESGELRSMLAISRRIGGVIGNYESMYAGDYQEPVPHLTLGLCEDLKMEFMENFILGPRYANKEETEE